MLIRMKEDVQMVNYSNDNEPDFWSSIGLQAAMILNKLRLQAQIDLTEQEICDRDPEPAASHRDSDRKTERGEYVEKRLADLREFERRAKGIQKLR
jgi:hypothetical protein